MVLTASIYSCGPAVTTIKPTDDNLNKYSTFSYLPNAAIEMSTEGLSTEDTNTMIINQINRKMIDEGYKVDRTNPDLLVLVSTKVNEETVTNTDPVYARYGYYNRPNMRVNSYYNNSYYRGYANYPNVVGYDTDSYTYEDGTLIIQLVDRLSRETVWKGISSTDIYDTTSTIALTDLVNTIFEEYPLMKK
jgi:hypothetical protein